MLAGIKTGKKKQKKAPPPSQTPLDANEAVAAALRMGKSPAGAGIETTTARMRPPTIAMIPTTHSVSGKSEEDMSMAELLVHEKSQRSMAEQETRTLLRQHKYSNKRKEPYDSDEEEAQTMQQWKQTSNLTKAARREHDRQVASYRKDTGTAVKCWWWVESSRFATQRWIHSSSNVTLVLNHPRGLIPGKHLFLTPVPYVSALAQADETVWSELLQYQSSLRRMAKEQNEGVLFWETVIPNKGTWQTRMEVLFVPMAIAQDAPLYFRSALTEQADEWGTHQKLRTVERLRHAVPENFHYFYVEYGVHDAHLQMIENKSFPKDFGADTIAGMMDLPPLRMRKAQGVGSQEESTLVKEFQEQFKPFDWTNAAAKTSK